MASAHHVELTTPSRSPPQLGNLIRLLPLSVDDLPFHPAFTKILPSHETSNTTESHPPDGSRSGDDTPSQGSGRPVLIPFIKAILLEATSFIDDCVPNTFKESSLKSSPPSINKVSISKRTIFPAELSRIPWTNSEIPRQVSRTQTLNMKEAWFARTSRHANQSEEGTADFPEFEEGLRVDHNEHEREYTPDLFDSHKVVDWDEETANIRTIEEFSDISMTVYEMCHELPFPLSPRVFSILVVTAKTGRFDFIIAQIPVDIRSLPEAFYSNGRNIREGDSALKRKKTILGVYTSIERCRILPDQDIQWVMAVASDAKGWLPMWLQELSLPGAIAKDVGLVIKWLTKRRGRRT